MREAFEEALRRASPPAPPAQAAVQAVAQSATDGILRVDNELHLTPLAALEEDPKLAKLRTALDKRVGEAQLPADPQALMMGSTHGTIAA